MRVVLCLLVFLAAHWTHAQGYRVEPIGDINSEITEIPNTLIGDSLVVQVQEENDIYSDIAQANNFKNQLQFFQRKEDWSTFIDGNLLSFSGLRGRPMISAFYLEKDNELLVCMVDSKLGTYDVFFTKKMANSWTRLQPLNLNSKNSNALHPSLSKSGDQLFFASDAAGGKGGFDIYYLNKTETGWSEPIPVKGLNTKADEFYPVVQNGELYFSSNRNSETGFDIFKATKRSQWRESVALPEPVNSSSNDYSICFLTPLRGFFASDRNTANPDVWSFEQYFTENSALQYSGLLEALGTAVPNTEVEIFNELRERVFIGKTDERGRFPLDQLKLNRTYSVRFNGLTNELNAASTFYVLDKALRKIMAFKPGIDGMFVFELLPEDELDAMTMIENDDQSSLLNIDVKGELSEPSGEEVQDGTPIYIVNKDGGLSEVAYTTDQGQFRFENLSPQAQYTFQLDEENNNLRIVIVDGEERIEVPIDGKEGTYERVKEQDAIRINNENGEPIVIRSNDLFVIENIYFEFDKADLNLAAKYQLDLLAEIMRENPGIYIELTSHTDSRGEAEYNLDLSDKRAQNSMKYLLSKDIPIQRMKAKGKGESVLLNTCTDGAECSEEEHALNRRTEIRIYLK